jgi:hypothetical protein
MNLLQVQGHVPLPVGQHRRDLRQGHAMQGGAGGVWRSHFPMLIIFSGSGNETFGVR